MTVVVDTNIIMDALQERQLKIKTKFFIYMLDHFSKL